VILMRTFYRFHPLCLVFPSIENRLALIQSDFQTLFLYRFFERRR
jgi:hypothetical protein